MSREYTPAEKSAIIKHLLADRCENYGYDWKMFRRISNQRSRARRAVRRICNDDFSPEGFGLNHGLQWFALTDRVVCKHTEKGIAVHYVAGQSPNEEITNVLRALVNPSARWVS